MNDDNIGSFLSPLRNRSGIASAKLIHFYDLVALVRRDEECVFKNVNLVWFYVTYKSQGKEKLNSFHTILTTIP